MAEILIVEDERLLRWALQKHLERSGHTVHSAADLAAAERHLERRRPDLMLLDLQLPDGHGLNFYEGNHGSLEETVVIVMTALSQVEEAVRAMKLGALDFLTKPVDLGELLELVARSLAARADQLEVRAARRTREQQLDADVVADSRSFVRCVEIAEQVAAAEVETILIEGETGSGKNMIARHIHAYSTRRARPILEVSCATLPEQLVESELFGHERGAFTDAKAAKLGTFELAAGGTVVLDEIGEFRLDLQAKLLHFLEERTFRRVGGTREIRVDLRVIALTNRDLRSMVREGSFRSDLFHRLSVFPLVLPPLRERPEDILPLARHFVASLQQKLGRHFEGFDRDVENLLLGYSWPGNVRELRNVIERAMVLERGSRLSASSLILDWAEKAAPNGDLIETEAGGLPNGIVPLAELERLMVDRAMRTAGGNQTRAAELLGVTRDQLRYRLKKFELGASKS